MCVQQMRIATRRRPRHTLTLVWVAGRAVCLSPPDTTQGTVTKEGQGRATWHARTPSTLPMAGQRPKRWKREAAFVRSFVHDTRCARNMRAVAATRGWVGQQEGSSWQVKQQQKSVRKSPSPRSTYNGGGDGEATGMRRHSKSWRIRVPTHTKGECDKRTSSDGCQTLSRRLWTPECLAGQRPTLLQCCGRQPLPQRLLSHTASRRRWPFVAMTRQRTAAAHSTVASSFRITDMMCVWTCNGGERSGRNGRNGGSRGGSRVDGRGGEKANGGRLHWAGLVWLDDRRRRRER